MSFLDEVGKIAGAIAAEQAVDKLDPDAGFLEKAASAFAGYEATKIAEEKLGMVLPSSFVYSTKSTTAERNIRAASQIVD